MRNDVIENLRTQSYPEIALPFLLQLSGLDVHQGIQRSMFMVPMLFISGTKHC